jgi:hypothetical protein
MPYIWRPRASEKGASDKTHRIMFFLHYADAASGAIALATHVAAHKPYGTYTMNAPIIAPQTNNSETHTPAGLDDDLVPDDRDPEEPGAARDKTQEKVQKRQKDLLEIREERSNKQRRKILRVSRLARYRADLVVLRTLGATYGEIALWLKKKKKVTVATTTIIRYLAGLPEIRKNSAENDK